MFRFASFFHALFEPEAQAASGPCAALSGNLVLLKPLQSPAADIGPYLELAGAQKRGAGVYRCPVESGRPRTYRIAAAGRAGTASTGPLAAPRCQAPGQS